MTSVKESFEKWQNQVYSKDKVDESIQNEQLLFTIALNKLVDEGLIDEKKAAEANFEYMMRTFGKTMRTDRRRSVDPEINEVIQKARESISSWTDEEKKKFIEEHFEQMNQTFDEFFVKGGVGEKAGFTFAFLAALTIFDLLFIPWGLWVAYKTGSGRN
jgi:hypothetical protein